MSYTEIYGFDKKGNAYLAAQIPNAWRGMVAILNTLEKRYLPKYRAPWIPNDIPDEVIEQRPYYQVTRVQSFIVNGDQKGIQEVWNLIYDDRLKDCEKIALASTFDGVIIKKKNFQRLITAFREFEGETSLKEQADIIEKMLHDRNCIAVGFNQSSINTDSWGVLGGYDKELNKNIPYNIFTGNKHWELFQELEKRMERVLKVDQDTHSKEKT